MELGNIPKIDQFKDNKAVEMQQVKSTSNLAKTDEQRELQQIQKKSIDQAKENSDVQKAQNESASKSKYEVVLSNTNFGFNSSSQDFFVRVERGTAENQYPTVDMMRVKAQNESTSKSKYEVTLSNTNFGFNNSSQDFFVRVERGTAENQYPTEDMMRVKAQMRALQKADSES